MTIIRTYVGMMGAKLREIVEMVLNNIVPVCKLVKDVLNLQNNIQ